MNKVADETEVQLRVAWEYYVGDRNQAEIAAAHGISRATVSRILKRARANGLVKITIDVENGLCLEVETALRGAFALKSAHVVPSAGSEEQVSEALGYAAAAYLARHVDEFGVIAVGWGRTISHIARFARRERHGSPKTSGEIVEMVGAFSASSPQLHSLRLAANLAQRLQMSASVLAAPAFAPDAETCQILKNHDPIRRVLERAREASLAIASLGTADEHSTLYQSGLISRGELDALRGQGAVGDILGRFFDQDGAPVASELDDRLIGITLDDLQRIPTVMVLAGGRVKREAILAALRGHLVSHLVTDEETARWILRQVGVAPAGAKES